ncbi:MAG: glutaminyl-peptide cyclotransferase [Candidatus Bathyarchaeota archaeon]|nr:glutaminyl-peptide cyclotransferase [Candidatus Termiticorpusculum sp.]
MKKSHIKIATTTALTLIIIIISIAAINTTQWAPSNKTPTQTTTFHGVPVYSYKVIQTYPHDSSAFTQGLTFDNKGNLIESTGLNGASSLRRVNLSDGKILQQINLAEEYFGEGITVVDDKIIQLTWQNKIGFIYNQETFDLLGNFKLNTEGWGLTYDNKHLILSDGTSKLHFLDTNTYQTINSINVHDAEGPVENLNELEYINGTIYANIWFSTKIAIINPTTGQVEAYIDLEELAQPHTTKNREAVLNGIAYNTQTNQLYITGKNWPNLYEILITKPK